MHSSWFILLNGSLKHYCTFLTIIFCHFTRSFCVSTAFIAFRALPCPFSTFSRSRSPRNWRWTFTIFLKCFHLVRFTTTSFLGFSWLSTYTVTNTPPLHLTSSILSVIMNISCGLVLVSGLWVFFEIQHCSIKLSTLFRSYSSLSFRICTPISRCGPCDPQDLPNAPSLMAMDTTLFRSRITSSK